MPAHQTTFESMIDLALTDIRERGKSLSDSEARFLVSNYYLFQDARMRLSNQSRTLLKDNDTNNIVSLTKGVFELSEKNTKKVLDYYTRNHPMGEWMRRVYGIGPIISAGLLANIDITKCPTAGNLHAYAGLDPTRPRVDKNKLRITPPYLPAGAEHRFQEFLENPKRNYNGTVKRLCWIIGDCFFKFSGQDECLYGKLFLQRKAYETLNNENGKYAAEAARQLAWKDFGDNQTRTLLEQGKLSPAHIHARAKRWTVKLFLSHLQEVWYEVATGIKPPKPYAISHLNHAHYIAPMPFDKDETNSMDYVPPQSTP